MSQRSLITMAASRTARYVALYRALETVERRRAPLFQDPFAIRFLPPALARTVRAARHTAVHALVRRYADHRAPGARTSAVGRTKILDDVVRTAVAAGTTQLVILGAGFDCRAHRLPELAAVDVFEVDRPETQAEKQTLIGGIRDGVHYVPVDFLRDSVSGRLSAAGWNPAETTCFLWEGVTNYLTEEAVKEVLAWIGDAAAGSTVAFTYIHKGLLDGTVPFAGGAKMLANVRHLNEPWTFGLYPEDLPAYLRQFGLTLREDLGADDYRARTGLTHASGYAFYRLAVAAR
jgi:methyltransferase (TIGR00027 family)